MNPMTVADLIAELQKLPPDAQVIIPEGEMPGDSLGACIRVEGMVRFIKTVTTPEGYTYDVEVEECPSPTDTINLVYIYAM